VILELLAIGDGLSGRLFCEQRPAREFSGRIGLMRAIDDLIDASSNDVHLPGDHGPEAVHRRPGAEGGGPQP